ncbi:M64 family metallopeptidase [Paracoccus sp. 22332]|uniref:M64 family metallopeptidase n=1 Tax=Paracoccus sp. 22332 TaxID=3453913 RepID=UPI003F85C91E
MATSDGTVIGMTKIFDSGSPASRWNLVIVSDGYRNTDMAQFAADADAIRDFIFAVPPFDRPEIIAGINIYRLDVTSTDSGADNPDCDGVNGGATTAATYFDSTFCSDGTTQRLLSGDSALVEATVASLLPDWNQIQVLVNDPERGGAGGTIAWSSNQSSDWREVVLHEIGHSAFELADEYDYGGPDIFADGEPDEVNVTIQPDPALVKWKALVTAGSASPTRSNPSCASTDPGPSPVAAGVVGTFEGAKYSHCEAFRPVWTCMMRDTADPFCPVCTGKIVADLAPFAQPTPGGDVTLATPTVDFNDVPTGLTVNRAARFNVNSALPVTFQIITAPTAPFAPAIGTLVVAPPAGPAPWPGYVWLQFQAGATQGPVPSQQITIRCLETGEDFLVTLVANVIARPRVATQLVFDKSGSMLDLTDEGRTKEQVLRDAASVFADLLWDDNGIGINAYDHDPHPILDVAVAGAPGAGQGRDAAIAAIGAHVSNPAGMTAIGDGIELAAQKLTGAPGTWDNRAMLVMTDGIETADKRIADVADAITSEVYAVGLGTPEQIRPATLNALTSGTGGYLLMTGNLSTDDGFLLEKYYLQILAGVNNNDVVLDPEGRIAPGEVVRIPFDVTEQDVEITAIALGKPAHFFIMALETPAGDIVGFGDPALIARASPQVMHMRAGLPLLAGGKPAQAGRWTLLLALNPRGTGIKDNPGWSGASFTIPYSVSVTALSNLRMTPALHQSSLQPGATVTARAVLTEYGAIFRGSAAVRAELVRPDGTTALLPLPAVAGDPGVFQNTVVADQSGVWKFRFLASGMTSHEQPFMREALRTAAVWQGGDNPNGGGDPSGGGSDPGSGDGVDWGDLLECLFCGNVIDPRLAERLKSAGLNLDELCRCLKTAKRCGCKGDDRTDIIKRIAALLR